MVSGFRKDILKVFDEYCMIPNSLVLSYSLALVTVAMPRKSFWLDLTVIILMILEMMK